MMVLSRSQSRGCAG